MAYISVAKLAHIRFMCHKILPLVYDESLSYYEVLCKVAYKLNEAIEAVNNLNGNVTDLNSRCNTMQEEIEAIANEINTFESEVTQRFNTLETSLNNKVDTAIADMEQSIDGKFNSLENRVDSEIAGLENDINDFKDYVNAQYSAFEARIKEVLRQEIAVIDNRFENLETELRGYIYTELQKVIDAIPEITTVTIISPLTGQLTDIQTVIYQLYDAFRIYALTCDEFDALGMTCDELDHIEVEGIPRGLTAYEWDFLAKNLIGQGKKGFVNNYLTGELVPLQVNVDINNAMIKQSGCYECSEFDSIGGTADTIDAVGITALAWDWQSNNYYVA